MNVRVAFVRLLERTNLRRGLLGLGGLLLCSLVSCASPVGDAHYAVRDGVIVSVVDQKMAVMRNGALVKTYPVSTSKFGEGDRKGSYHTPLGFMTVSKKVGGTQPEGMVFKRQRPTGEILKPNAPGRDPIVSRIITLNGREKQNRNAGRRGIFIHGTPEEYKIGSPASYGCIRMRSSDVVELYGYMDKGMPVVIEKCSLVKSLDYSRQKYNDRIGADGGGERGRIASAQS